MTENGAIKYFYKRMELGDIENDTQQNAYEMAVDALEEIQNYRALGTVEELMVAKEKQIPKKPVKKSFIVPYEGINVCPSCKEPLGGKKHYCCECGQKLDWGD